MIGFPGWKRQTCCVIFLLQVLTSQDKTTVCVAIYSHFHNRVHFHHSNQEIITSILEVILEPHKHTLPALPGTLSSVPMEMRMGYVSTTPTWTKMLNTVKDRKEVENTDVIQEMDQSIDKFGRICNNFDHLWIWQKFGLELELGYWMDFHEICSTHSCSP